MNNVIYIDVLIGVNIFVNYFLILATSKFSHSEFKIKRVVLASILGSLFSVLILFDTINYILMFFIKFILGILLVFIAFGYKQKNIFIKNILTFIVINFIFAGTMMAIWIFITPTAMYYNNGVVYFNISAVTLVISTIIAYIIIKLIRFFIDNRVAKSDIKLVEIYDKNEKIILKGFIDTGNKLTDIFTNTPVHILNFNVIKNIIPIELHNTFLNYINGELPQNIDNNFTNKIKIIPFNLIQGDGLLLCFIPEKIIIDNKICRGFLGVSKNQISNGEYDILLNNNSNKI